jgi:ECF transporter S component (folate family)
MQKKKLFTLKALVMAAMFVALSIVFARMFSIRVSEGLRLSFGQTPIILAGILLGPWWGLIVGVVADVTGFMIAPMGAYIPGLTLTSGLIGLIPGLIYKYVIKNNITWALIVSVVIDMLIVNGLLATFFLALVYSKRTFEAWLIARMPVELVMIVVQVVICLALAKALRPILYSREQNIQLPADEAEEVEEAAE